MWYAGLYVASIVLVNWLFDKVPMQTLFDEAWSPVALIVGFIFVVRDYAQRAIGHYVLIAMAIGAIISFYMATPAIALASLSAFLVGELFDWAVYTFTGKPFAQRVLLSSLVSTPIDSIVFLSMVGYCTTVGVILMTLSKLFGALIVYFIIKHREKTELQPC